MKTTRLINNHEAAQPMNLTELMLVNALGQIEDLEDEIGSLKTIVERQTQLLEMIKERTRFRKDRDHNGKYDSIGIESVYCDEPNYRTLMEAFGLKDEAEETAEKEEADGLQ